MIGASIETTRELWASSLREVKKRIRPLFAQERAALNAGLFVDGLLGDERRKTGWMRAEAAGDPGPWRQQAVLGRDRWDADALRDLVRDYATEHLADENAVLVIDETGFLKQGKASCGVARQYTGSAGKITNCQIGVFADADHCETDKRGGGSRIALEVAGEAPTVADPGERSLDDPAFGKHDEAMQFIALDDRQLPGASLGDGGRGLLPPVPGISEDKLDEGEEAACAPIEDEQSAVAILHSGRVDDDVQQQAERVDQDMPFAAGDLLGRIKALRVKRGAPF